MRLIKSLLVYCILLLGIRITFGQTPSTDMDSKPTQTNPLLCDVETGMCEMPEQEASATAVHMQLAAGEKIHIVYFTDPICSSCWGIEPQLRKLKRVYGHQIEIEYRMGGLLPDWSYNSGGISKPSDVAHHWDEVSIHYDMPIDGDVWLEDPLDSSYPPSIAFKAAQMQDEKKAHLFMREIRERVFLKKQNIAKWEHLAAAAANVGLDVEQMAADVTGPAKDRFQEDLRLAKAYRVRGFPTMFFEDEEGNREIVYGTKPFAAYEAAILKLQADAKQAAYAQDWESLFSLYTSYTAKEFAELSGLSRQDSEARLNELVEQGELERLTTKNGSIWTRK